VAPYYLKGRIPRSDCEPGKLIRPQLASSAKSMEGLIAMMGKAKDECVVAPLPPALLMACADTLPRSSLTASASSCTATATKRAPVGRARWRS
jgi:hypothetical protein